LTIANGGATLIKQIQTPMHPTHTQSILRIPTALTVVLLVSIFCAVCLAVLRQEKFTAAQKFDEFWNLRTDDVQAHLDRFAKQVVKDQSFEAFIVSYRSDDILPGSFLREIYGFRDYLVNSLGVEPRRLKVVDGGISEKPTTELWLVPSGVNPPRVPATRALALNSPMQFDRLQLGTGCIGEYTLVLQESGDALKFFAATLRENPTFKGFILVRPSEREPLLKARRLAVDSKQLLVKEYGIAADRIVSRLEGRRLCSEIGLWLAPPDIAVPKNQSVGLFFQAQLMAEAEQNQYWVRRVELLGNTYTRDNVIRRRILQNEGDIFRRKLLEQSLRNISKLRNFNPVGIQDVEVHLSKEDKLIDFLINLTERTRSRKRRIQ
jgi:hypothetical protein